jgi:hypothetical protein
MNEIAILLVDDEPRNADSALRHLLHEDVAARPGSIITWSSRSSSISCAGSSSRAGRRGPSAR